jgi:general secretion pathway protein M
MSLQTVHLDLSPPVRRIAALGLLLVVVLVIIALITPLIGDLSEAQDNLAQQREAVARFRELTARLPQLQAEHAALQRNVTAEQGFLQGANDTLRAAEMQNRIKTIVEAHGGRLMSTQITTPRDENGFRRVTAQAVISAAPETLVPILYDCENSAPYLFIDGFEIHTRPVARQDDPKVTKIVLDIRLEFSAYARVAAP